MILIGLKSAPPPHTPHSTWRDSPTGTLGGMPRPCSSLVFMLETILDTGDPIIGDAILDHGSV